MAVFVHRLLALAAAALAAAALSACGAKDSGTADVAPVAGYAGAGAAGGMSGSAGVEGAGGSGGGPGPGYLSDGGAGVGHGTDAGGGPRAFESTPGGGEPLQADTAQSLGGRATYQGNATGSYAAGKTSLDRRSFGAKVTLTADFGDNYIWGAITGGTDTLTLEEIFERLTLEPAPLGADETSLFRSRVTGTVNDRAFTGEWRGWFSGGVSRGAVAGTFWAQTDDQEGGLSGSWNAPYQAHANRTAGALGALSEKIKGRLAHRIATTARADAVSSSGAATGVSWNTGVTQSSRNASSRDGVQVNQAINASYVGDDLVFDRVNLLSQATERLTTSDDPEAPGYRQAFSPILGSPRWTGVEYLSVDSSRRWNYSILFSDISGADDTDYLAGGFSFSFPDVEDPAQRDFPSVTVAASGSDPFQVANIEPLEGRATYDGDAAGFYASKLATPALRYFNGDVRLTADFDGGWIWGVVTEGRDTATNEVVFAGLGLGWARLETEGAAFFEGRGRVAGVVNGRLVTGDWGGQLFGNGESSTDVPGSVAGTFGARSHDRTESIVGYFGAYDRELTRLPAGHGLEAGKIVVQPGESGERGDVSIACPEGGLACIVTVGADGDAFYDRDGGIPVLDSVHGSHWQDNPGAEDLLDHWNDPERLREAMDDLPAVSDADAAGRKTVLTGLLNAAGGDSAETGRLRNVSPDDIELIGERDGITYGRWTGGPAGTLNIEFDWRFAPNFDAATRARMERAGKSWSWRLLDDFGTHVAEQGREIRYNARTESVVLDEALTADDILILVLDRGDTTISSAGPREREDLDDDHEPWLGILRLSRRHTAYTGTMAHEVGHVIGVVDWNVPALTRYINTDDYTFEGPEAMRANGGAPVPFQWVNYELVPLAPHAPGAEVDYGHLGVCDSIMAYCRERTAIYVPSELDFAYLADIGYEILDAETASEPELYGYGAWGRYSAWGAGVERTIEYEGGRVVEAHDSLRAGADAFGTAPGAALGQGDDPLQGNVTWSGSLIGVDLGQAMLPPVFGDAELSVELSSLTGTALFDDLTVHVDGVSSDFRVSSKSYAIDVAGNSFSDQDGRLQGGFFGPAHEEMAGVLDDRTAEVNLLAGFGGKR